jgi:uncharacterized protein YggE
MRVLQSALLTGVFMGLAAPVLANHGGDPMHEATRASGVIHVSATASANVVPDRASVTAGVESRASTAQAAMAENSTKMRAVYDALGQIGVNRRDVTTSYLNLSPRFEYDRKSGEQKAAGYQASNQITVTTSDLDNIGAMIDALLVAGLNNIQNINFTVKDRDAAMEKARTEAIRKARLKAESMTEAAGVSLGKLLVITEGNQPGSFAPVAGDVMMRSEAAMAPPISPGQQELSATVTLSYAID